MKVYELVSRQDTYQLIEAVLTWIDKGYAPVGGVCESNSGMFIQAMYKAPTKKPKPRASNYVYPIWFKNLWDRYPKRAGSNPKHKAWMAINARCEKGKVPLSTLDGVIRYADFCNVTGKTGTEYVMQAATFFGPDKHYLTDWTIPEKKITIPADNSKLADFAVEHGLHEPGKAPEFIKNDYEYRQWIQTKL